MEMFSSRIGLHALAMFLWIPLSLFTAAAPGNLLEGVTPEKATITGGGTMSVLPVEGRLFTQAVHAVCPEKKKQTWDVSLMHFTSAPVRKGERLLLVFHARGSSAEGPEGMAVTTVMAQKASPEWGQSFSKEVRLGPSWKRMVFPFTAKSDFAAGDLKIVFMLGGLKQEVDVGGLALHAFGQGEEGDAALAAAMGDGIPDRPLDLSRFANMGFKDEAAGDGKGGWSDQGPKRDLSLFDAAQTNFGGMAFRVLDPAKNGGKAILVFKSSHLASSGVPLGEAELPTAGAPGTFLYLLHATAWCGPEGERVGTVTLSLKSGQKKSFDVLCRRDVGDWVGAKPLENAAVVATQAYPAGYNASLYVSKFQFAELPEAVERVSVKTAGEAIWMIAGATLSGRDTGVVPFAPKRKIVIQPHRPINLPPENPPPPLVVKDGIVIASPMPSTAPVVNPGKGWVLYGKVENQPPEVLSIASLGYQRYQWGDLEPEEGRFDWSRIDSDLAGWSNLGKQFSFGVMNASTHSKAFWASPKWVFDAGAKYKTVVLGSNQIETSGIPGPKLSPVFDDPIFMQKLGNFLAALAARYDGHPNLAFIDIRSVGNWGESHMGGMEQPDLSAEKYHAHLKLHTAVFKKTLLSLCCGRDIYAHLYPWCVSNRITMRRDGICGNSDGSDVLPAAGLLPAVFEFYGSYEFMKNLGWWDGKQDRSGNGYRLADCVEVGQATWCDLSRGGRSAQKLLTAEPVLVAELANRLGYHVVLREARYPARVSPGAAFALKVKWENLGVAPMFIPAAVVYALVDDSGKTVARCNASATKTTEWKPGLVVEREDAPSFTGVKPGTYSLAVGLVRPGENEPGIRIAVETKTAGGWQILGPLEVK